MACCNPARSGREAVQGAEAVQGGDPEEAAIDLVPLSGGTFLMGSTYHKAYEEDGEGPVRAVTLSPFAIAPCTVTNAEFARFVERTGYATQAEREGWSFVFHLLLSPMAKRQARAAAAGTPWWYRVDGASWRTPEGPESTIEDRPDHPVVHVSWHDAMAYAAWSGTSLPTEAQWEYAARGGLEQAMFPWGNEPTPDQQHMCNVWQGRFPGFNSADDGYIGTAPVRSFPPNGFGLFQMAGNVWEWCADSFHTDYHRATSAADPVDERPSEARTLKGGSFLCHESYCHRYRNGARTGNTSASTSSNTGFRVARSHAASAGP